MKVRVDIWHNLLWSKYKGAVFSELHRESVRQGIDARFFQIAETESDRHGLASVDLSYHKYPFELIAKGEYQEIPLACRITTLFWKTLTSPADLVVIACYDKVEYWAQLIAVLLRSKKVMVFCDSTFLDRPRHNFKDVLKRWFFQHCDGFFCYGERSKKYLEFYGVPTERIFVRCQAAALPRDYSRKRVLERRLASLSGGHPPAILYVGRLAPEKNLPLLLKAFRMVCNQRPTCILKLVGEGPERGRLEQIVAQLGLAGNVVFVGGLSGDSLFDEYLKAACLVLPSSSEPWGLVVNEALSFGCPVVVSDQCGCVPELVRDGRTGYSFPTFDADALNERVLSTLQLIETDSGIADNCIDIMSNFTPQCAARAMMSGINAILSQ